MDRCGSFAIICLLGFSYGCSTAALKTHNPEMFWLGRSMERSESEVEIKLTFVTDIGDGSDAIGFMTLNYPNKKSCKKNEPCVPFPITELELEGKRKGDAITLYHMQRGSEGFPKRATIVRFKDPRGEFLNVEVEVIQMIPFTNVTMHRTILVQTHENSRSKSLARN